MIKTLILCGVLGLSSLLAASADGWGTDYQAALTQAKAQNKKVLLDFTGSDWCGYCKLLDQQVFSTPTFQQFADKNYVLVTIDFPQSKTLPAEVKSQNDSLGSRFQVNGYPTLIVIDPSTADGKELGRSSGYDPGSGPDAVIAELKKSTPGA